MLDGLKSDLLEAPFKLSSARPLPHAQLHAQSVDKHQAIYNAYHSGSYTQVTSTCRF
jgi:hypothetical protein